MISTIIPEEELERSFLGVQKVRNLGNGNLAMNVGKWFSAGEYIQIHKKDKTILLSKSKKGGITRTVKKSGAATYLSLYNICDAGYYSISYNKKDIELRLATTEETLRFARKSKRTDVGECLVMKGTGIQIYLKKEDLKMFPQDAKLFAEFHQTEDNLMWFEVFSDGAYSKNATRCNITNKNLLYVPNEIAKNTNLNKSDVLKCWKNGDRLIVELPNISCETCGDTIKRKTQKSKTVTISQSTKDTCVIVRNQISEAEGSKESQIANALKAARTINKLLM